jgi:hypothetical protein
MDYGILKDNLDFYEKINNVTKINDKITNELNGAIGHLYSLTTFNSWLVKFNPEDETISFIYKTYEYGGSSDRFTDVIFKLVYLRYLIENLAKENKGLRIIQNYIEYTDSDIDDLHDDLYSYMNIRKGYSSNNDDNIDCLEQYIYSLQDRLNNIQKLLEELR